MDVKYHADRIRILAIGCKNHDVMSCEFGNEFGDKVEEYIREEILKDISSEDIYEMLKGMTLKEVLDLGYNVDVQPMEENDDTT